MDPTKHPECIDPELLRLTAELPSVRELRTLPVESRYCRAFGHLYQVVAFHLEARPYDAGSIELRTAMLRATAYTLTDAEFDELLARPLTDPTAMTEQDFADEVLDDVDEERAELEATA